MAIRRTRARLLRCRFGGFVLDEAARELRDAEGALDLQPKELALLVHLVRHRERVVRYEELRETIWSRGSGSVKPGSVHRAVSRVRTVLRRGASAEPPIRTHARLGYRFVAPVEDEPPAENDRTLTRVAHVAVVAVQFVAAKRLAPDAWLAALQTARAVSTAIVARFGGTTTAATGHGVLAHFTRPKASAADVALGAARALADAVRGMPLGVRIGIHADAATLIRRGTPARDLAVGEATAGALRVREHARPGWIVVSDELLGELGPSVRSVALRRRGRGRPAHRVLAPRSRPATRERR
jgi:DNA-binding winged helix-turn-helix (wHTH) protein